MSTIAACWTEGHIVLAADSRTTICRAIDENRVEPIGWTDEGETLFCCPHAALGLAFAGPGTVGNHFVSNLIRQFIRGNDATALSLHGALFGLIDKLRNEAGGLRTAVQRSLFLLLDGFQRGRPQVGFFQDGMVRFDLRSCGFISNQSSLPFPFLFRRGLPGLSKELVKYLGTIEKKQWRVRLTGGPIDLLAITPGGAFWLERKPRTGEFATLRDWELAFADGRIPFSSLHNQGRQEEDHSTWERVLSLVRSKFQ